MKILFDTALFIQGYQSCRSLSKAPIYLTIKYILHLDKHDCVLENNYRSKVYQDWPTKLISVFISAICSKLMKIQSAIINK